MLTLQVARWVTARLVRQPWTWLAVVVLAGCWPVVALSSPVGLTTTRATEAGALYEVAFLGCIVAALAAQGTLDRGEALLVPLPPGRRLAAEIGGHLAAAAVVLLPVGLVAWFAHAPRSAFAWDRLPSGTLLCHLHLAVLAVVLGRTPLSSGARLAAIPVVAWALPALAAGLAGPLRSLSSILDPGGHLDLALERPTSVAQRITAGLPIIGWSALSLLLTSPRSHALRRTR